MPRLGCLMSINFIRTHLNYCLEIFEPQCYTFALIPLHLLKTFRTEFNYFPQI